MSDEHILVERVGHAPEVSTIRFNRPDKKNAITDAMYLRMADALHAANADPEIRVVAFLGTEGCFSAGNDMADFLAFAMSGGKGKLAALELLKALVAFGRSQQQILSVAQDGDGRLQPQPVQDPIRGSRSGAGSGLQPARAETHGTPARLCAACHGRRFFRRAGIAGRNDLESRRP